MKTLKALGLVTVIALLAATFVAGGQAWAEPTPPSDIEAMYLPRPSIEGFCDGVSEIPITECEALVALYQATDGPNWTNRTNWLVTTTPSNWYGVTVEEGHVAEISLPNNQLNGTIPAALGNLSSLRSLVMPTNQLTGTIPSEIEDLSQLTMLYLYNNQLNGSIPAGLSKLTHLAYLSLMNNELSGSIPTELGQATSLTSLNLGLNRLSGPIPSEIGNLTSLTELRLSKNALEGEIPASIVNLVNLLVMVMPGQTDYYTDLSYNKLQTASPDIVAFLNQKDPDWQDTQTVPPQDLVVIGRSATSIALGWSPIIYKADGGYYEVLFRDSPTGTYQVGFTTADKSSSSAIVDGLTLGGTYDLAVRSYTPAHWNQKNDLLSEPSAELSVVTGYPFSPSQGWSRNFTINSGGWSSQNTYPRLLGDVDGDGRADIVGFGSKATYVSLSNGAGFASPTAWINDFAVNAGGWTSYNTYPRALGDVNGDGRDDVVAFGNKATYVALSNGAGFDGPSAWIANFGVSAGGWTSQDLYPRLLGDVNGDGRDDIVGFGNQATYVSLSNGAGFDAPRGWIRNFAVNAGGWTSYDIYPRALGDVNGDGRADIVGFGKSGVMVGLSTGYAFLPPTCWLNAFGVLAGGWTSQDTYPRTVADVGGDGRADIVGFGNKATFVSYSTGSTFYAQTTGIGAYGVSAGGWTSFDYYPRHIADVTADRKADIVGMGRIYTFVSLAQ